jgi:lipooligosaccharide transport system permease protein
MSSLESALPRWWRWYPVWKRNALVWRKLALPALLGNIGEPLLYLVALGFGLGAMVGEIKGTDYLTFLASGFVCASVMNTASFEAIYSSYTRLAVQDTWTAMLYTPLEVEDILLGEVMWAATKGVISAIAILLVAVGLDAVHSWEALWILPVAFFVGLAFAAMALVMTAIARSYDFFMFYFTLALTPMLLFGGVFFPLDNMPPLVQQLANLLPLTHAIEIMRPLANGLPVEHLLLHLAVPCGYGIVSYLLALHLVRRRLHR